MVFRFALTRAFLGTIFCLLSIYYLTAPAATAQDDSVKAVIAASARNFKFKMLEHEPSQIDMPSGPMYPTLSDVTAINDAGMFVGTAQTRPSATTSVLLPDPFVFENGKFVTIAGPIFGVESTVPIAINNRNQVLLGDSIHRYFLYDTGEKTFRPVGFFAQVAGIPDRVRVTVTGLNDSGQFVGYFAYRGKQYGGYGTLVLGAVGSTAIPTEPGSFTQLACPDGRAMNANSINNHGQITGSCGYLNGPSTGFLFSDGKVSLFQYPDADLTMGNSINDAGNIVGVARLPHPGMSTGIGFAFDGKQFVPVAVCPDLDNFRGLVSAAKGINNKGQIVGKHCGGRDGNSGFLASATASNALQLSGGR